MKMLAKILWIGINIVSMICGIVIAALIAIGVVHIMAPMMSEGQAGCLPFVLAIPVVIIAAVIYAVVIATITHFILK